MSSEKPLIFISCGQYTEAEKLLGKNICLLLDELRPDVSHYFAEDQSSLEGLSNHILKALFRASGFICVMHDRGTLETPGKRVVTRGSVWIEQEIAIAAFMHHALGRTIPILFYKHRAVTVEGIRSVLLMNPRLEFTEESEVLHNLRLALPSTPFIPFKSYDVEPILSYICINRGGGDRHTYVLTADVQNVGTERVTDFELRLFFL
jgi:hypothetical protein